MNFFEVGARPDFAGYWPDVVEGGVADERIVGGYAQRELAHSEYLGDPPRRPKKRGDFHKSAYAYLFKDSALPLVSASARERLIKSPTRILGREAEAFSQVWVTNFVDCLDLERTQTSPASGHYKDKIGVIRRPVFDISRWDGSELFVVPQDPSFALYCSEDFLARWRAAKLKGARFYRYLMDPTPIDC